MSVGRLLEITFILIVLYLVLSRGKEFSSAIGKIGETYVSGVKALQGR